MGSQTNKRFDQLSPLLRLAWPILVSQLAISGMGVVDTIMAGQISPVDLAGVAVAFSIWLPVLMFMVGLFSATSAMVAHAWGDSNMSLARIHIWQSIWLAVALGIASSVLISQSQWLLNAMDTGRSHGFFQPYAQDRGGVAPEPWHISHQPSAGHYEQHFCRDWLESVIVGSHIELKSEIVDNLDDILRRFVGLPKESFSEKGD